MCVYTGDMSPYCSAHDEWLIMKLCMYVRYHTANNVSNCGGDPVTQLHFITIFTVFSHLRHVKRLGICLPRGRSRSIINIHAGGLNASTDAAQVAYVLNVTPAIPT